MEDGQTGGAHLLKATMPPNALMGSARTASLYASLKSVRLAMPHGLVCLTTTQVASAAGTPSFTLG